MPDSSSNHRIKLNPRLIAALILVFGFILSLALVSAASPMRSSIPQSAPANATAK